jgi:hypothetical protein
LWRYLESGGRRALAVWHRRSGKDDVALHWAACAAMQEVGNYWHMLPEAEQARKAIWNAVNPHTGRRRIDEAFPSAICNKRDQDMLIKFVNGSTWQLVGSDNYNSLVGSTPRGVVFSEWALANPSAWAFLRPILAENGGWALFITTPRGKNHAKAMADAYRDDPAWFVQELPATETGVFTPEQLESERAAYAAEYGEAEGFALFQQEYLVSYDAAVVGAYYAGEMAEARQDGRISRVPYEPAAPVETWWDLGISDTMAIWFAQRVGREIRLIDYYQANGQGLAHYAKVLQGKPYVYGRHIGPHDIEVRELGTGQSRLEVAKALGIAFEIAPNLPVQDGIDAARRILSRCWFDEKNCEQGIAALQHYRKAYDEKNRVFRPTPLHNWASHPSDAFRYGAVAGEGRGAAPDMAAVRARLRQGRASGWMAA